jgi:hypothetical protein
MANHQWPITNHQWPMAHGQTEMDSLLVALHMPTAPGRKGTRTTTLTDAFRPRRAFPDWRAEGFDSSSSSVGGGGEGEGALPPPPSPSPSMNPNPFVPMTPRMAGAASTCIDVPEVQVNGR